MDNRKNYCVYSLFAFFIAFYIEESLNYQYVIQAETTIEAEQYKTVK